MKVLRKIWAPAAFFLYGLAGFVKYWLGFDFSQLPGDMGDTRFNQIVMEHNYKYLLGQVDSFWSLGIYFPVENTKAMSDSHILSSVFYILPRLLGASQGTALQVFVLLGFVLNFGAAYWASRKLGLTHFFAGFAALLFSASIPVWGQVNHIQLHYRFFVPVYILFLVRWYENRDFKDLFIVALMGVLQFFFNFYIAYFMFLFLVVYFAVQLIHKNISLFSGTWTSFRRRRLLFSLGFAVLFIPVLLVLAHYSKITDITGYRPLDYVAQELPKFVTYFHTSGKSDLWDESLDFGPMLTMPGEHVGYMGLFIYIGFAFFWLQRYRKGESFFRINNPTDQLGFVALFLMAWTLSFGKISLYRPFLVIDQLTTFRVMSRIVLFLLFPLSVIAGIAYQRWLAEHKTSRIWWRPLNLLFVFAVLELWPKGSYYFPKSHLETGYIARQNILNKEKPDLFSISSSEKLEWKVYMDAAQLSVVSSVPTLGGYSGHAPPKFSPVLTCEAAKQRIIDNAEWGKVQLMPGTEKKVLIFLDNNDYKLCDIRI